MEINGCTRTIGLMGNPIEHTLSPLIHNYISRSLDISNVYVPFKVTNKGLEEAVKGAYELNILGLNVTVPHKTNVMEYLTDVDERAMHIGAVNTLVRDDSMHGYKGYNTDLLGLMRQIDEDGIDLAGRTVVILGAGGAACAVVYMCLIKGAKKIYILNRTYNKAKMLSDRMNRLVKEGKIDVCDTSVNLLNISDFDEIDGNNLIVFQATSRGLAPNIDDVVIDAPSFYDRIDVGVDLIYNPACTRFMKLVKEHGGRAYNALKMLLYQGVTAYELWNKIEIDDNVLEEVYIELKRKLYHKDNVILIGFMGSGKSTVGKALARELGMNYVDTDEYIEHSAGMTITDIFESKGEEEFRRMETEALSKLMEESTGCVISTGGGVPLRQENVRVLKENGKIIYLTAANQVIYERIKDDTDRPLLQGSDPYGKICTMMKERKAKYEKASDIIIDTNSNDISEVVEDIKKYL